MGTSPTLPRIGFRPVIAILVVAVLGMLAWREGYAKGTFGMGFSPRVPSRVLAGANATAPGGSAGSLAKASPDAPLVTAAQATTAVQRFVRLGLPVYCGGRLGNFVALTFDDGPGPYTQQTMQILKAWGDRATFFLVGKKLQYSPELPPQEAAMGAIGDHTWDHIPLPNLPPLQQRSEIVRTKTALATSTGTQILMFRPPMEEHSSSLDSLVISLGMLQVMWSADSQDSAGVNEEEFLSNVRAGLRPGAIILMHENRGTTLAGLEAILQDIRGLGLKTVTVPELLALDPPTPAQVRTDARAGECVPPSSGPNAFFAEGHRS